MLDIKGESYEESVGNFASFCRHGRNDGRAGFLTGQGQEGRYKESPGEKGRSEKRRGEGRSEEGSARGCSEVRKGCSGCTGSCKDCSQEGRQDGRRQKGRRQESRQENYRGRQGH